MCRRQTCRRLAAEERPSCGVSEPELDNAPASLSNLKEQPPLQLF